ncbi:folate-binding protein YgfZ [Pacificimonas sp. WHA3]|uniref:Folate-binding protein YgfZ n=1 Tax=Pacificimonas pallii TaxID=2827236 RepID=A0ABS6SG10_9SPHN|nr:folate-binding protein [Pacificimonas pallii]MBV7257190.1 folate-binding protein YgfZ [Pacificimonas pallii]
MRLHAPEGAEGSLAAFLNGLVTTDVTKVTSGHSLWAGLLSAQGKYLADMFIFAGGQGGVGEELLLDLPAQRYDAAMAALKRYRLRQKIDIGDSRQQMFAGWGDPLLVRPDDPRSPALGKRWHAAVETVTGELADYHAHRIATGIPDSVDFEADRLMWLESGADLLNGVDFTKGCFVGQENTARMNYRGKVRKRILPVTLSGAPEDETEIVAQGKAAGTLTSAAEVDGEWLGMAHLRLEMSDAPLTLGDHDVDVRWPDWLPREGKG